MRTIYFLIGTVIYIVVAWLLAWLGTYGGWNGLLATGALMGFGLLVFWWVWLGVLAMFLLVDITSYANRNKI